MKKRLIVLGVALTAVFLAAFVASAIGRSGSDASSWFKIHSATIIRTPINGQIGVGLQLWNKSGTAVRHADVRFNTFKLTEIQPGSYNVGLNVNQIINPFSFTIRISPNFIGNLPKEAVVISAYYPNFYNKVTIDSPLDGQVFNRHTNKIHVHWQLHSGPAPILLWIDDLDASGYIVNSLLPASTTSYDIDMSGIPINCTRLRIEVNGPDSIFTLTGPVSPDSIVAIRSAHHILVTIIHP